MARSRTLVLTLLVGLALLVGAFAPPVARADIFRLKDGRTIEGELVAESESHLTVKVIKGDMESTLVLERKEVASVEERETPRSIYVRRRAALDSSSYVDVVELAEWCLENDRKNDAAEHYLRATELEPGEPLPVRRLRELGWRKDDAGRWTSGGDYYRDKGWVRHGGDWMPKEKAALLSDRDEIARKLKRTHRLVDNYDEAIVELEEAVLEAKRRVDKSGRNVAEQEAEAGRNRFELKIAEGALAIWRARSTDALRPIERERAKKIALEHERKVAAYSKEQRKLDREVENAKEQRHDLEEKAAKAERELREAKRDYENGDETIARLEGELARAEARLAGWNEKHPGGETPTTPSGPTTTGKTAPTPAPAARPAAGWREKLRQKLREKRRRQGGGS